jgi:hypothetical protein
VRLAPDQLVDGGAHPVPVDEAVLIGQVVGVRQVGGCPRPPPSQVSGAGSGFADIRDEVRVSQMTKLVSALTRR